MQSGFLRFLIVALACCVSLPLWRARASAQTASHKSSGLSTATTTGVSKGAILVKGAWSSASDSTTPVPEGGGVTDNVFRDEYFGITYPLPQGWTQKYAGPPPSDTGRYVLAQISLADTHTGKTRAYFVITADDLFFTPIPAANALQFANYTENHLSADYKLDPKPAEIEIGGRPFAFYAYRSPVAGLHWYVLATQIRCHTLEIVVASRDTSLMDSVIQDLKDKMKLPAEAGPTAGLGGGAVPVCIKDYAYSQDLIAAVEPVFTEHKFNAVPVRIIIDRKGKVKFIHLLSAFPDQQKAVIDALKRWKFRPYQQNGNAVEVETGIMLGRAPAPRQPKPASGSGGRRARASAPHAPLATP